MNNSGNKICQFCAVTVGKYTCPKCNFVYCSVDCYQSERHLNCSESFYKDCVISCLKTESSGQNEKKKMIEALKREHDASLDCDDDDDISLGERLSGLDLDNADSQLILSCLTKEEKSEFIGMVKSGKIQQCVPKWIPWWNQKYSGLITEVEDGKDVEETSEVPPLPTNLAPLSSLTKVPPADCIQFNLINLIYSYAYVVKHFNGDHHEFVLDLYRSVVAVSRTLGCGEIFSCVRTALQSAILEIQNDKLNSLFVSNEVSAENVIDVENIINGPNERQNTLYVLSLLHDLLNLLKEAKRNLNDRDSRKNVNLMLKKIEYFIGWTVEYGKCLVHLLPDMRIEYLSIMENIMSQNSAEQTFVKTGTSDSCVKAPLIEELN